LTKMQQRDVDASPLYQKAKPTGAKADRRSEEVGTDG